ncbi:mannose-6-phosphate isomerase, class I [Xylanivirga thermophila]|jgi:mannose-6-phosphate isomerase|uniref:mannose-6-phosphate isomerase, class I n=1 Tax=Xylanivirga thermophila TaxID=2496273 RepID=UPI00101CF9FB|nr:mannose-6-phosphate isomerase, class I [Xylanivirga thermophila]
MLYPLIFEPVLKERIWGGTTLHAKYGRELPSDKVGESWDVACHKNGMSKISNGELKGKTLKEVIDEYGKDLLGKDLQDKHIKKFPLLIKILDATDVLSVQVHPDDEYAKVHEDGELGKTEMWYIIDAKPGAKLVYGVKEDTTKEQFEKAIKAGKLEEYLNTIDVAPGDVVYIPAGMVHAIGAGILICEVQQNSDTTYRVYDWNRVDDTGKARELHIKQALDVIDFEGKHSTEKVMGLSRQKGESQVTYYVANKYFAMEKLDVIHELEQQVNGERFFILTVVEGEGKIVYFGGTQEFKAGQSIMIPACMKDYTIEGNCTIIKSYIPDIENDIVKPLIQIGFDRKDLSKRIAGL